MLCVGKSTCFSPAVAVSEQLFSILTLVLGSSPPSCHGLKNCFAALVKILWPC